MPKWQSLYRCNFADLETSLSRSLIKPVDFELLAFFGNS
jgi:hypothetical protein